MDEWTCQRDTEEMKRHSTGRNDDGDGDESEGNDEGAEGDNVVGGRATPVSDNHAAADNITVTQPVTLVTATPPDSTQPVVVTAAGDGQGTVYVTSPPPFVSVDRASVVTSTPQVVTVSTQPPSSYAAPAIFSTPQRPNLQTRQSDGGFSVGFALPPTLSSTPQVLGTHAALPVDLSMGQGSSGPYHGSGAYAGGDSSHQWARPKIRLTPISLPKFSGDRRDYWRWKAEWESIQAQAEPTGSRECKKLHLLDSIDETVKGELRLLRCRDANDIFRELENHYGDKAQTAEEIVLELQSRPAVKNHQPRETLELILAVERAALDITDLGCVDALQNQLVIRSLESKLPDVMKREWLMYVRNPGNNVQPGNRFDRLLLFLEDQKSLLVRLEQLLPSKPWSANAPERPNYREKPSDRKREKKSFTKTTASEIKRDSQQIPCSVCDDDEHRGKLFRCKAFRKATVPEKKAHVKKAKACTKCLDVHKVDGTCTPKFLCRKEECRKGDTPADHHYFLCTKAPTKRDAARKENKAERRKDLVGQQRSKRLYSLS